MSPPAASTPSPASICSSPKSRAECAEAVLKLMADKGERARLAEAGRARMLSNHAWPKSMQRLDGIIERCRSEFSQPTRGVGLAPQPN